MSRRYLLLFISFAFCAALTASAADTKEEAVTKAAMQKIVEFVGEWKGNGKTKLTGKETFWKETLSLGWKFADGQSWLALSVKDGKFLTSGEIRYDADKKAYKLTLVDKSKKELAFDGALVKGNLVFTGKDAESGDVQKVTLYTLAEGARMVLKSETQARGKGLFNEQFTLAANKEGESFAGGGPKKPECVVTGGAGTIAVSFAGKTFYVCCSGCKDEFEANPKKYVDAFEKAKK